MWAHDSCKTFNNLLPGAEFLANWISWRNTIGSNCTPIMNTSLLASAYDDFTRSLKDDVVIFVKGQLEHNTFDLRILFSKIIGPSVLCRFRMHDFRIRFLFRTYKKHQFRSSCIAFQSKQIIDQTFRYSSGSCFFLSKIMAWQVWDHFIA